MLPKTTLFGRAMTLGATLALAGCSDLIGLERGFAAASCTVSSDCAPHQICRNDSCYSKCGSDQECEGSDTCLQGICLRGECVPGDRRCGGLLPQVCNDEQRWADLDDRCEMACDRGRCIRRPSCDFDQKCSDEQVSCCLTDPIPGGSFELPYSDMGARASVQVEVQPFALDRFEVTISRFLTFLSAYGDARKPAESAGMIPDVPGSGWKQSWSDNPELMSPTAASLQRSMIGCGASLDETFHDLPVVCVSWYVASAFCIWDGGRLPSEAEWTFAAMGGDEQRPYPWSSPKFDATIDEKRACYDDVGDSCPGTVPVGSYPSGKGRWNTRDLAGNVLEWTADIWQPNPAQPTCSRGDVADASADLGSEGTCALDEAPLRRDEKGGSFAHMSQFLLNSERSFGIAAKKVDFAGFRCAFDVQQD